MTKLLTILFLTVPLLELYILIHVGSLVGALPTVALVILTAIIGILLIRHQGIQTILRARSKLEHGDLPTSEVTEAMLLLLSAGLLLAPGFCTDCMGFLVLIPKVRIAIASNIPTPDTQGTTHYAAGHPFTVDSKPRRREKRKQIFH